MFFNFLKRRSGLNKIELLVVIAILAILVSLAVPQFLGYTRQAETTRLLNNGKIIESAVARYYMANEEWPIIEGQAAITPSVIALDGEILHRDNPRISGKTFYTVDEIAITERISRTDTARFVVDGGGIVYILNPAHIDATGLQLNLTSILLRSGETANIDALVIPTNASIRGVAWETSNASVASVSDEGIITAHAAGHATISVYTLNYRSYSGTVNVTVIPAITATITMTPSTGINTNTNILFTHNTESNGTAIVAAEWRLNADAPAQTPPSGMFLVGEHTVWLRVQDDTGQWSEWVSTTFNVAGIPVASIGMTPQIGITTATNIIFNDTASTPGEGTITAREWRRNGVTVASPPNGTFIEGNHAVSLRVQNSVGTWSAWETRTFSVVSSSEIAFYNNPTNTASIDTTNIWTSTGPLSGDGVSAILGNASRTGRLITRQLFPPAFNPFFLSGGIVDVYFRGRLPVITVASRQAEFGIGTTVFRQRMLTGGTVITEITNGTTAIPLSINYAGTFREFRIKINNRNFSTLPYADFFIDGVLVGTLPSALNDRAAFSVIGPQGDTPANRIALDWVRIEYSAGTN